MTECNSAECNSCETHNIYPNLYVSLSDQQQFWQFVAEIKERELMRKRLSKYIASFDYFDKSLIVLSVTTGSTAIASFATVIGASVGKTSASLSLAFSISTGIIKKLLNNKNKKEKNNKILILARNKLDSIESKIFNY